MNVKVGQFIVDFVRNRFAGFDSIVLPFVRKMARNSIEIRDKKSVLILISRSIGNAILSIFIGIVYLIIAKLDWGMSVFVLLFAALLMYLPIKKIRDRVQSVNEDIIKSLPDLIGAIVLLLETGLTLRSTFYQASQIISNDTELSKLLKECIRDIENGSGEAAALINLSTKTNSRELNRFCGSLVQNIKNGNKELVSYLSILKAECETEKKVMYKAKGERMSSKLLLPMAMLLVSVLVITAGPAIISLA